MIYTQMGVSLQILFNFFFQIKISITYFFIQSLANEQNDGKCAMALYLFLICEQCVDRLTME